MVSGTFNFEPWGYFEFVYIEAWHRHLFDLLSLVDTSQMCVAFQGWVSCAWAWHTSMLVACTLLEPRYEVGHAAVSFSILMDYEYFGHLKCEISIIKIEC
jgi:hypothetical protein